MPKTDVTQPTISAHEPDISDAVVLRVYNEYLELPGLRLTCQQAEKLFGLHEPTCVQLLEFLVEARFLRRSVQGLYSRLSDGPAQCPLPRAAKAGLEGRPMTVKPAV